MLKDRLATDFKEAVKKAFETKDATEKNTIQSIRASVLQYEKDNQEEVNDEMIEAIILKEKKKRQDALEQFKKANREDLIKQTEDEIVVLERYLPKMLSREEIKEQLQDIIKDMPEVNMKSFGPIMKTAKEKMGNKADGKVISETLKELLS